jgi:hypothetical protein
MKNMLKTFSWLFGLILVVSVGCQHDTDNFDGPNLIDRFGEFELIDSLTVSTEVVDFSAGETVDFGASFNKRVDFFVVITGTVSGAKKIIQGFDNQLTPGNATWRGGTTNLPFFGEELCTVELIIPEADSLTLTDEVTVAGRRSYPGSVFTDFETDPLDDLVFGNFEFEFTNNTGRRNDGMAAEGDWYYFFEGTDDVVPNFFVGLIDMKATITGENYIPLPTTVPEEVYFNAFLYADGGPHGIGVIQFIFDSNDSGAFEDGQDAAFQIEGDYPLNWVGWRHVHHPMSELGFTQEQLEKLVAIRMLLISDMNSQPSPPLQVDYGVDYITFTAGGPLEL